jgi:hypothetical protein
VAEQSTVNFVGGEEVEIYRYAVADLKSEGGAAGKIEADELVERPE